MFSFGLKEEFKNCCKKCKHRKTKLYIDLDVDVCEKMSKYINWNISKNVCDEFEEKEEVVNNMFNLRRIK